MINGSIWRGQWQGVRKEPSSLLALSHGEGQSRHTRPPACRDSSSAGGDPYKTHDGRHGWSISQGHSNSPWRIKKGKQQDTPEERRQGARGLASRHSTRNHPQLQRNQSPPITKRQTQSGGRASGSPGHQMGHSKQSKPPCCFGLDGNILNPISFTVNNCTAVITTTPFRPLPQKHLVYSLILWTCTCKFLYSKGNLKSIKKHNLKYFL